MDAGQLKEPSDELLEEDLLRAAKRIRRRRGVTIHASLIAAAIAGISALAVVPLYEPTWTQAVSLAAVSCAALLLGLNLIGWIFAARPTLPPDSQLLAGFRAGPPSPAPPPMADSARHAPDPRNVNDASASAAGTNP